MPWAFRVHLIRALPVYADNIFYSDLKRKINMIFLSKFTLNGIYFNCFISVSSLTWHFVLAVLHTEYFTNTL